jgi:hypothetical protein
MAQLIKDNGHYAVLPAVGTPGCSEPPVLAAL